MLPSVVRASTVLAAGVVVVVRVGEPADLEAYGGCGHRGASTVDGSSDW
jgi:hypothetical protein